MSFSKDSLKLHMLFSCTPWAYGHRSNENDGSFSSFVNGLGHIAWANIKQQHFASLKQYMRIQDIPDGISIMCMKRVQDGVKCLQVLTQQDTGVVVDNSTDFFVAMVAPTQDQYTMFENANMLSSPDVRQPVIDHMMKKAHDTAKDVTKLVARCNLAHLSQTLTF